MAASQNACTFNANNWIILCEMNPSTSFQASISLQSVFCRTSKYAHWLITFILQKVIVNLSVWSSEESVARMSVSLLKNLSKEQYR